MPPFLPPFFFYDQGKIETFSTVSKRVYKMLSINQGNQRLKYIYAIEVKQVPRVVTYVIYDFFFFWVNIWFNNWKKASRLALYRCVSFSLYIYFIKEWGLYTMRFKWKKINLREGVSSQKYQRRFKNYCCFSDN